MKVDPMTVEDVAANLEPVLSFKEGGVRELIQRLQCSSKRGHGVLPDNTLVLERSCEHPAVVNGVCNDCCQTIEEDGNYGLDFSYLHMGLRLSRGEIDRLRCLETERLFSQKKLHLVLDIDNTLIHSFRSEAFSKLGVPKYDMQEVDGIFVKLRPLVSDFLERASTMFEMHLYTLGSRSYAKKMAKILDPQDKYFDHRIISRDESPGLVKTLDLVLGMESSILILDDNDEVWPNHERNLILMKEFLFTGKKTDENEMNTPLNDILKALSAIHTAFFDDNIQATFRDRDVRELASSVRSTVLKGCNLYVSNVKYSGILRLIAKELGATCSKELNHSVTHLVSCYKGTEDFNRAVREEKYLDDDTKTEQSKRSSSQSHIHYFPSSVTPADSEVPFLVHKHSPMRMGGTGAKNKVWKFLQQQSGYEQIITDDQKNDGKKVEREIFIKILYVCFARKSF
ncbi:PREDICTED: RNA polymerase II C-terminal domain phosphatase-like 4 [Theobroma cacao]|uniref:RNA polymerase II C-terminal domain phosphatase-like n=1 Tax=Theobroma cacao TaxID=3641 RepID=A0AB32WXJ1_THECC|nr:PREDICTED: RNA polymerase II C-terminal domain phosphatase-like 4 [Theobroma cacao]